MPKHGYLLNDNRASGGILFETDTTNCRHCQAVVDKRKWRADNGVWKCTKCDGPICDHCAFNPTGGAECDPWQKKVERQLKLNEMVLRG